MLIHMTQSERCYWWRCAFCVLWFGFRSKFFM